MARYLTGELRPEADPLVAAVHRLLGHADAVRTLGVRANADTPDDARRARELGAAGIGLCAPSTCSSASAGNWSSG
ncbi:putative PEP-binding protein [Micromonospora sp. b486]|uniref:putative PEP-binding protein n=1 Tax=Micromonospora sp. b486 TaxID=3053986 RepID=UPI00259D0CE7|nr:putative PEP-binding protein [Micromonospora sp. b486]MDM4784398.1 hypothetical protein [Micromonospora sp. b486]